jgi:hypothetical protein
MTPFASVDNAVGHRRLAALPQGLAVLLLLAVGVYFPLPTLLVLLYFAASRLHRFGAPIVVVVALTSLFAWMNVEKSLVGDWVWYSEHFQLLTVLPFGEYLGERIPPFTIKSSEPVYYFVSFLVARATEGNLAVLAVVVTALIYVPVGVAATIVAQRQLGASALVGLPVAVAMLGGITFTITTQLVRQVLAASLLLLSLVLLHVGRRFLAVVLLLLALLSHTSVLIPFAAVAVAIVVGTSRSGVRWPFVGVLGAGFLGAGLVYTRLPLAEGYNAALADDGTISLAVLALDASLFGMLFLFRHRLGRLGRLPHVLLAAVAVYACFLAGVSSAPIPFLRMYLYLEIARVLAVVCLTCVAARSSQAFHLLLGALVMAVAYLELRVATSPFSFNGGFLSHLLHPFVFGSPLGR